MNRSTKVRSGVAVGFAGVGAAIALLGPGSPAVAYSSGGLFLDVHPSGTATTLARGAALDVPIDFTCNSAPYTSIYVQVSERVGGKKTANGDGYATVACTGGHQRTIVTVTARNNAFVKGDAFASATINGCQNSYYYNCGSETGTATISVLR